MKIPASRPDRRRFLTFGGCSLLGFWSEPSWAVDLVVIVHPTIELTPSRADLNAIFTTRMQWWAGTRLVPLNFPAKQEFRIAFDEHVLNMSPDEVGRYWIDRRIRGGSAPPKQVPSAAMVVKLVEKLPGAIGYVPRSLVSSRVRVIGRF